MEVSELLEGGGRRVLGSGEWAPSNLGGGLCIGGRHFNLSRDSSTRIGESTLVCKNLIFVFKNPKEVEEALDAASGSSCFNERTEDASALQYFQFYGYLSQQQNMMQDFVRTATYQRAILANLGDFEGKVVLDVGAGSGILSFFALQAGARKVYAIEASSMALHAKRLAEANGVADRLIVVAGKVEEVSIPEEVDVIVSEPMGYMLFNERMLETFLHAKKWLKPGGKMFPSKGVLHVAPFSDDALYLEQANKANFWQQQSFHGVDLSSLHGAALAEYFKQPVVDTFDVRVCVAKSCQHVVDFSLAQENDLHTIDLQLDFEILETAHVHGLAFWFDVAFESERTVWLSTSPTEPLTHWYQVRCLVERPILCKQGSRMVGRCVLEANRRQSYDVSIELRNGSEISSNSLDLKNPYFRYTGQPAPPPGLHSTAPSEALWAEGVKVVNGSDPVQQFILPGGEVGFSVLPANEVNYWIPQQQPQQQHQNNPSF